MVHCKRALSAVQKLAVLLSLFIVMSAAHGQMAGPTLAQESGVRAGSGDDFDNIEIYTRWDSEWLQTEVIERISLADWRARWDLTAGYWDGRLMTMAFSRSVLLPSGGRRALTGGCLLVCSQP